MAKDFAESFYKSKRWRTCRAAYISERTRVNGGLCEKCNERAGYMVHHKVLLTATNINDPSITLNPEHLEFLCKECHDREEGHFFDSAKKRTNPARCTFDADGQPVPIPPVDLICEGVENRKG